LKTPQSTKGETLIPLKKASVLRWYLLKQIFPFKLFAVALPQIMSVWFHANLLHPSSSSISCHSGTSHLATSRAFPDTLYLGVFIFFALSAIFSSFSGTSFFLKKKPVRD
jgi:hypothetical protein